MVLERVVKAVLPEAVSKRLSVARARARDVRTIVSSHLFDADWYAWQTGRRWRSRGEAVSHYVFVGRRRGLSPHPLFEASWFDQSGWHSSSTDPYARLLRGEAGAGAHPWFDAEEWTAGHEGARGHRFGPYGHFLSITHEDTIMPRAVGAPGPPGLTWGQMLERRRAETSAWARQEALVDLARTTRHHDWAADREYVARWSRTPLPEVPGDGPLVTVVMPVRNRATTVLAAIASVRSQTLQDWELVVVDDGSTDATAAVVEVVTRHEPRVRLVRAEHAGVSAARNLAADHARGEYLAWLDSDNVWTPTFLRTSLSALHAAGGRVGYAQSQLVAAGGVVRYRSLDAGVEALEVRNHVDLNVLVAQRGLVEEVGGFDESLRRTVDHDLAWRVGRRATLHHLPFVGVVYDDEEKVAEERVTTRELRAWREVVRSKNLVDWEALDAGLADRVAGRTSVVLAARTGWRPAWDSVASVLAATDKDGGEVEVVVVDSGMRRGDGAVLRALCAGDDRVRIRRLASTGYTALAWNFGLPHTTGDVVVLLDEGGQVQTGCLQGLQGALADPGVTAAQPLVIDPGGAIGSGGALFNGLDPLPEIFLSDFPLDDASRLSPIADVDASWGPVVAVRTVDLVRLRGVDCRYANGWETTDTSLRLGAPEGGRTVLVTRSHVITAGAADARPGDVEREATNRSVFRDTWRVRPAGERARLWGQLGFEVARPVTVEARGGTRDVRRPSPVLVRPARPADGHNRPCLRWSIRTATPFGKEAGRWGDLHFARSLAAALERLGQQVVVDYRTTLDRSSGQLDDVVVALRGRVAVPVQTGSVNLLWVISHPGLVSREEAAAYSAVFAAGPAWAEAACARWGLEVQPLLQATDSRRFGPDAGAPGNGEQVLFVGNSRNVYRPVVRHLVEAGVPVAVYGGRWEQFLPAGHLRGDHVDNEQLARFYREAGVVLNDHWAQMRSEGFVSNRLFDAAASGARVVSDDVAGAEELFGGLVRVYRSPGELVELVRRHRQVFPDDDERRAVADRVRAEHSFDARAQTLVESALSLRGSPAGR